MRLIDKDKGRGFNNLRKYGVGFWLHMRVRNTAHSRLRNYFSSAAVESKDKSDSGIIEFSSLSIYSYALCA